MTKQAASGKRLVGYGVFGVMWGGVIAATGSVSSLVLMVVAAGVWVVGVWKQGEP